MMDRTAGETTGDRHLRAVGDGPVRDAAALGAALEAVVAAAHGGIAPRSLGPAVAAHLGVPVDAIVPEALTAALGLLIATSRVDEIGGRLVAVARERRQAG